MIIRGVQPGHGLPAPTSLVKQKFEAELAKLQPRQLVNRSAGAYMKVSVTDDDDDDDGAAREQPLEAI